MISWVRPWRWFAHQYVRRSAQVGVVAACALEAYSGQQVGLNSYFVLAVLTLAAVILRRRAPAGLALVAGPAMGWSGLSLAPVVLLFTAGHREARRWVLVALVVWTVASSALLSPWPPAEWISIDVTLRLAGGWLMRAVLIAGAVGLGQLLRVHQAQTVLMGDLVAGRAREQALAEHAARADERAELAREMHDVVASQVTVIAVQAGALRMVSGEDPRVREIAEVIRVAATRTTRELREVLAVLRETPGEARISAQEHLSCSQGHQDEDGVHQAGPSAQSPASGTGAGSTTASPGPGPAPAEIPSDVGPASAPADEVCLQGIGRLWQDSGCRGELVLQVPPQVVVSTAMQRAAYRIVQEGLTNAARYAPGAQVRVGVEVVSSTVVVSVINGPALSEKAVLSAVGEPPRPPDGAEEAGVPPSRSMAPVSPESMSALSTGHGLLGARERAEALGGHASWGPMAGGGFQLVAVMPLRC